MTPAQALLITAAGALLMAYATESQAPAIDDSVPELDDVDEPLPPPGPDWTNYLDLTVSTARSAFSPTSAAGMVPSAALLAMLKRGEALRLARYRLGDGGWTLGYGRYFPDSGSPPPASITRETAEAWFLEDVEARGARWVRTYVTAPLTQQQFDALVSMAFNLSPKSFKTIADAVNAGDDPEAASLRFVRAGTNLEAGLRNRRAREIALYRQGTYA